MYIYKDVRFELELMFMTLAMVPTYFTNPSEGPTVIDENNPAVAVIIKGKDVPNTIIHGGSGVNVINRRTCDELGIQEWEPCPFWLRIADTSSVQPTRLIRNLKITIGGHAFRISAVVLKLSAPGAYPILLGRPWLKTALIKKNWQRNVISFCHAKTKV